MSLWENEETARERLLQRILIGVGAAVATLVVIWVLRNAIALISQPRNGVGFAGSTQERRYLDNGESGEASSAGPSSPSSRPATFSPASPVRQPSAPSYTIAARPTNTAPAPLRLSPALTGDGTVLTPQEQAEARYALLPLRQTYAAIQDFDQRSFWNQSGAVPVHPVVTRLGTQHYTYINDGGPGGGGASSSVRGTGEAVSYDPGSVQEVDNATDALGAMVALYGHPSRFPEPVRGAVSAAAEGMRGYLKLTMDAATTNDPAQRQRMRSIATKRLSDSNTALQRADTLINTGGGSYVAGLSN